MPAPSSEWSAYVAAAQRGDQEGFDALVRQFEDMAVGYAYSLLGDFQLAEDAAQDAFVQAYLDLRTLREPQAFPAWLRRLVFKHCDRVTRRKRVPTVPLDSGVEVADGQPGPEEAVQQRESQETVLSAIQALPEQEREATTLFYINGYSLADVGQFLEVPVGTVKSRLHAARRKLREGMMAMVEDTLRQHAPDESFRQRVREAWQSVAAAPPVTTPWEVGSSRGRSEMVCLEESEEAVGYKVWIWKREPFVVAGYTITLPPGETVKAFWDAVASDGRLDKLAQASSVQTWVLGLGSWDPECEPGGMRYTICIEEMEHTDFSGISGEPTFFRKRIGASEWMCFETDFTAYPEQFWKDNAYDMLAKLGYTFHGRPGDYSIGLHFEAYPPGFFPEANSPMEFWITVAKA